MRIREYLFPAERDWAETFMESFGGAVHARRGGLIDVLDLPGFVAERDGVPVGLATYRTDGRECEVAFIGVLERHEGTGTALIDAVVNAAQNSERIWLVTTNDNLDALRFYQRRGFRLTALRPGAVDESRRRLKPGISCVGEFGIPLRDELELELIRQQ